MEESLILKSQARDIFELIKSIQLTPEDFKWETVSSNIGLLKVSRLVHINTNYYFQFDFVKTQHHYVCSPGNSTQVESATAGNWDNHIAAFKRWLQYLKREIEAPDLWSAIANEKVLSEVSYDNDDNATFSMEEKLRVAHSLNEIKQYLISIQSFSPEQKQYLDARFGYLINASERLGRKDWILLAVGTLTNIIIGLSLMPDIAREFLRIAGALLKWILINKLMN